MNRLAQVGTRARSMLSGFTPGQRGVILVAVLALALGAVALSRWVSQPSWSTLYANLSGADASAVVDQLRNQNVSYQLTNGGSTILVPQSQVYDLRVSLSGKGLPAGSGSGGYAQLDQLGITSTDFQQNVAYQRAMEGELAKTLQAISGVTTAIVHLAIPKKDVFSSETDHPTASVLLALAPGTVLTQAQIRSVMHLVAGAVPELNPSDVTVSDAAGNLLSVREDGTSGAAGAAGAAGQADQQTQQFEDAKSAAAQKMLDSVLGKGHAVVRVNAELNYDSSESTVESYQTQTGISPLSEQTSHESYAVGAGGAGGPLGQTFPTLTPGVGGSGGGTYVKDDKTVNNAVGRAVTKTTAAPGSVKRMTVAVVLDAKSAATTAQIQQLVANAVGIDPTRNDVVQVTQMAFDTSAAAAAKKELADAQSAARTAQYVDLGKKAGLGVLVLIAGLLLMRRRRAGDDARIEAVAHDLDGPYAALPSGAPSGSLVGSLAGAEQLAIGSAAIEALNAGEPEILDPTLERERLRDEVAQFVDSQPEEIAAIVQGWLGQRKS